MICEDVLAVILKKGEFADVVTWLVWCGLGECDIRADVLLFLNG